MQALLVAALLVAAPASARAEAATGKDLLWVCEHYGCYSEIVLLTQAIIKDRRAGAPYTAASDPVCFPPDATWEQIVAAVQRELKAHPEQLARPVHPLVLSYLAVAYPCVPT